MKKSILCCLSVFLLVLIAIVCAWAYGYGMEAAEADELHVIFVPGLWTEDNAPEFYEKYLKEAFPGCRFTVKQWKSNRMSWENAREGADLLSADLAKEVYAMTETERRNLVLVGHSIGARVVIRAMADINGYGMNIRRGVFLGAAIPDDDESISKALNASRCPCINISNRKDNVLAVLYSSIMGDYEECALGAYGSRVKYPEMSLVDVKIKPKEEAQEPDENFWDI
ncbi:MAG: DUF726 domain-containing protein [Bacteroidales bacterium]|nr:DUF726 domain-containing protein [Bacteroidales bacterium]